jgi:hypothetical protein
VCESLTTLGLQPCWVQQVAANACAVYEPKSFNFGYEPALSASEPDQVRRLRVVEVFAHAAQQFGVWLERFIEDFDVDQHMPSKLFRNISQSCISSVHAGLQGNAGFQGQIARARGKMILESKIADAMSNLAGEVISAVSRGLDEVFAADNDGQIQLVRFQAIKKVLIESAVSHLADFSKSFLEVAIRRIRCLFDWASGSFDVQNVWGTGVDIHAAVCASVKETVVQASVFGSFASSRPALTLVLFVQVLLMPLFSEDPDSSQVDLSSAFVQKAVNVVMNHDEDAFHDGGEVVLWRVMIAAALVPTSSQSSPSHCVHVCPDSTPHQVEFFVEEPNRLHRREQLEFR